MSKESRENSPAIHRWYKKVKEDHPDFPLFNLSLDGLDHAVDAMRLETFVTQAKNYQDSVVTHHN